MSDASVFEPVSTLADLETLDAEEIYQGYRDHERGDPEPGLNRGRAYWHGWMNAARDRGERPPTSESATLAHEYLEAERRRRMAS
jgi:hypothetical protein